MSILIKGMEMPKVEDEFVEVLIFGGGKVIPTYGKNNEYVKCLETVAEHLETLPAADVVERKTGKWLKSAWSIRCSECGYDMPFAVRNFCPNCGAKMEEDPFDDNPPMEYFESGGI